jgi:sRNA-binding protein
MRTEGRCLPMTIDIWGEIATRTDPAVHATLKVHIKVLAHAQPYLAACADEGAMRHDVDGNAIEPVMAAHRQRATRLLSRRKNAEASAQIVT